MDRGRMIEDFRAMVGWPYASPGSNDQRGIDCSGAFVRAYQRQGRVLYHGSNRMARCAMAWLTPIGEVIPRAGMAVFKAKGRVTGKAYQPGGAYYDPQRPEDYYHVGLVTSAVPLRVIHATPPWVREDRSLRGWTHIGQLKEVEEERMSERVVAAGSVNLREKPDKRSRLLAVLSQGTAVTAEAVDGVWCRVTALGQEGYCMSEFLGEAATATVALPRALCASLLAALTEAMG